MESVIPLMILVLIFVALSGQLVMDMLNHDIRVGVVMLMDSLRSHIKIYGGVTEDELRVFIATMGRILGKGDNFTLPFSKVVGSEGKERYVQSADRGAADFIFGFDLPVAGKYPVGVTMKYQVYLNPRVFYGAGLFYSSADIQTIEGKYYVVKNIVRSEFVD